MNEGDAEMEGRRDAERVRLRVDLIALVVMALAILVGLTAIAGRGFARPPAIIDPLPTATATTTPTPGWWATLPVTATPTLRGLPALPNLSLGDSGRGLQGGEPVAFSVVSCPRGDVKITAIKTGRPGWWNIYGTVTIPNLEYWKGELSPDGQSWIMLYRSNAAVRDGLLIEFNTRTVPRSAYQIRLTAVDRTGNYPEPCVIGVSIG